MDTAQGRPCCPPGDCEVPVGAAHVGECDVARCLVTGLQRLMCDLNHDCGSDTWSGLWPGEAECQEFGWLTGPDLPDLNRLHAEANWDPQTRRWMKPSP